MHKFEKRDAKSRTLVILAVVGLAAALTAGIFTAVRMFHKPAQSKDDPKTGIVYDDSAIEGGWDNLSPEEIAEKLNEKVAEGMINISMGSKIERAALDVELPAGTYECTAMFHNLDPVSGEIIGTAGAIITITVKN